MRRLLLTPGPLTTAEATRGAMLRDWGSREPDFIAVTAELRQRLLNVVNASSAHVAVPLQGSGTFVVEAAIATLIGPDAKVLVLINGAYGERFAAIAKRYGRSVETLVWPEDRPVNPAAVAAMLVKKPDVTHVAMVHVETTTGLLNPLSEVAAIVRKADRHFILDAMSSFGALPLDLSTTPVTCVLASSNKCLEGVPGIGFALVEKTVLEGAKDISPSLSLDLYAQWRGFEANGQWRFTPPVQVAAALVEALKLFDVEGGQPARLRRYQSNFDILAKGMRRLGFKLYLDPKDQAPIIATFCEPEDRPFAFETFYQGLAAQGFVIYPGKLTKAPSFRIGCIGAVEPADFVRLVQVIGEVTKIAALEPQTATP